MRNFVKTPYYIIDQKELDFSFNNLVNSLEMHWGNYAIGYSYKTNSLPWIINHFNKLSCYAEVVSEDEYNLAKLIGVEANKIIYNGPIKTKETFVEALNNGCYVNIDSAREIDWLDNVSNQNCKLGIRINFDIESLCPGQSQCAEEGGRFGFCYENGELKKAINKIKEKGYKIVGLHLHTSSKSRGLGIYSAIANMACKIKSEYDLNLSFVDIGGGFFGGLPTKPQFSDYISLVSSILKQEFDTEKTTLIVEPGMAIIGSPISYVTSVIDTKDTSFGRFVVTDGTRTSIDPLMTKKSYFHEYEYNNDSTIIEKQIICGYTCMEHDRLFVSENEPELTIGDKIIYHKVGAYTMCLTPLFIKYFPDVYINNQGTVRKVRNAWTPNEYVQQSIM